MAQLPPQQPYYPQPPQQPLQAPQQVAPSPTFSAPTFYATSQRVSGAGAIWLWGVVFGVILAILEIANVQVLVLYERYGSFVLHGIFAAYLLPQVDALSLVALTIVACFVAGLLAARQAQRARSGVWAGVIVATIGALIRVAIALYTYRQAAVLFDTPNFTATSFGAAELSMVVVTFLNVPLQLASGAGFGALGALLALRRPTATVVAAAPLQTTQYPQYPAMPTAPTASQPPQPPQQ